MKYMYTLSLFTRQFQCKKKKNPKKLNSFEFDSYDALSFKWCQ